MSISMQADPTAAAAQPVPTDRPPGDIAIDRAADLADQLANERRRLETVTTILGGWVWETDSRHRFIYMSANVEKLAGKRPEKHYGKTLEDLGILTVASVEKSSWLGQLEARTEFGPVDFVRYDNGKPFFMRTTGRPQLDADGTFTGYIGIAFALPENAVEEAAERRGAARRRTVRAAEIVLPGEASPISCVLVDISTTGARLSVPDGLELADAFELHVAALSLRTRCALRWRRNGEAGVEFVD